MSTEADVSLYVMTTGSMRPAIREGDVLLVESGARAPLLGELLLLPAAAGRAEKVVHRLLAIRDDGGRARLVTRGDANDFDDEPVALEAVLGRVIEIGRDDGGAPALAGWRRLAARAAGPLLRRWTLSGRLGRVDERLAAAYARLPWRPARRALLLAALELDALRRDALREALVAMLARLKRT